MPSFVCVGRDGMERQFEYKALEQSSSGEWRYIVTTIPPLSSGEFFELTVTELDGQTVRVVMMDHHNVLEYVAMGIPEALLPVAKAELGKIVQSSPTRGETADVRRSLPATKVWERLVASGSATYDSENDIYQCTSSN